MKCTAVKAAPALTPGCYGNADEKPLQKVREGFPVFMWATWGSQEE